MPISHFCKRHILNTQKPPNLDVAGLDKPFSQRFSAKARGVAILIKKNIPFQHISTKTDPNGRFIIVTGTILTAHVTLLNLYAPNFDNPGFFRGVFHLIPDLATTNLIVGGDFNCVLDTFLDRSSPSPTSPSDSTIVLNNLMKSLNLVDIWRIHNPTEKEFSFFSQVHNTFSRIDYFLIDSKLTAVIK